MDSGLNDPFARSERCGFREVKTGSWTELRYLNAKIGLATSVFALRLRAHFCRKFRFFMRRPKGIKTKKSVRKRFKITATGKVMTQRVGKRHLLSGKSPKRRRSLRESKEVHSTDVHRIKASLPWG